ncbi:MAG: hypothetical protein QNJ78_01775 [Gammaproteobacteria bacterium]|nr:hypothetical protein [Gammaproteobacteria bacterium]
MKRYVLLMGLIVSLSVAGVGLGVGAADDWRKSGSDAQKLKNLVAAVPGTSHWMFEIGERYKNLYWAAQQGKWEFANYQLEEIEKLVQMVQLTRPKRAATAQQFLDDGMPQMHKALETRQWNAFKRGFNQFSEACMRCHAQNDHAFIVLPREPKAASSPVLDMELDAD